MKKWNLVYKKEQKSIHSTSSGQERKSQKLDIEDIIIILLQNRGLTNKKDIEDFLNPRFEDVTVESVGIDKKQLVKAIKRIQKAISKNQKIVIFGDYDVDGICGSAILWETIYSFYKNVIPYIPHRVDEGYGLSIKGIDGLLKDHPETKLIITVDNGIVASEAVEYAAGKKLDVIITDHHVGVEKFPDAHSVVHTTKLCGAGVAYLLSQNIKNHPLTLLKTGVSKIKKIEEDNHLELVAIATVADLVPLIGANRTLVKFGIENIRNTKRIGLLELFKEGKIDKSNIGVYEIGHIIGPRINAMGRLMHGLDSLRLLCAKDKTKAVDLAQKLGITNRERQQLTDESAEHAKSVISSTVVNSRIAFVAHSDYNQGVIGLIASKLVEEYYRPSFAIAIGEKFSKGSARSIRGVNIIELIRSVSHTLVQAGGHPMAAGFTVETRRIEEFREELEKKASKIVTDDNLLRTVRIDMELPPSLISYDLYEKLDELAPFGVGNPEPVFSSEKVTIEDIRLLGKSRNHLKLWVTFTDGKRMEAIGFYIGEKFSTLKIGDLVDIAYTIDVNEWNGSRKLQLKIRDLRKL